MTFTARVADALRDRPSSQAPKGREWPAPLGAAAYHGVVGEMVRAIAPHTEADAAGVLVQMLVMLGNCIGRTPQFRVGADMHHMNLFAVLVGPTAKGRKGMSRNQALQVFDQVDDDWVRQCLTGGLSSGEGLIWTIRDPIEKKHPIKVKGRVTAYETVVEDHGIDDKRLMVIETEFASTLNVMTRDGNTLSPVLRQAWDGQDLRTLTKTSAARTTSPHISIIANVTSEELRRKLEATEAANGFGNRFLWLLVKRSRLLPHGGRAVALDTFTPRLAKAVTTARRISTVRRDEAADALWERVYEPLSRERAGMLGSMTARAEAQVMRLASLYALADATGLIGLPHLRAALEVWRFCFHSAAWLFGDRLGDPVADSILSELRRVWPESLTRTDLSQLFHRNKPVHEINRALALLLDNKLATVEQDRSGTGRFAERWAYTGNEKDEINEISQSE